MTFNGYHCYFILKNLYFTIQITVTVHKVLTVTNRYNGYCIKKLTPNCCSSSGSGDNQTKGMK